jgi:hypothetical protein
MSLRASNSDTKTKISSVASPLIAALIVPLFSLALCLTATASGALAWDGVGQNQDQHNQVAEGPAAAGNQQLGELSAEQREADQKALEQQAVVQQAEYQKAAEQQSADRAAEKSVGAQAADSAAEKAAGHEPADWWTEKTSEPQAADQRPAETQEKFGMLHWSNWRLHAEKVGAEDEKEPITIGGRVRHPVIFFAHVANRPWKIIPLFSFLFSIGGMLKLFLPGLTALVTKRCRTNLYASLSSAFLYGTVLITIIRFSFFNDDLAPMGIYTFGFLQLSFALGLALGANLFAHNLYSLLTRKGEPAKMAARVLLYGLSLTVVALLLTVVSMVPSLGPLPRVGNRIIMLIAALGLGGLVNYTAGLQKPAAQDSSGPL